MKALPILILATYAIGTPQASGDAKLFPNDGRAFHASLDTVGLVNPSGIALSSDTDTAYVADEDSNTIYAFDTVGALLFSFMGGGLSNPSGMDLTSRDGYIYVCSQETNDVKVFSATGAYLLAITGDGLTAPADLALTSDDCALYVASRGTNDIKVFDAVGTPLFSFSTPTMNLDPTGIALTSDDSHVYVSSAATDSIEVFTATGEHVDSIPVGGPTDVALTSDDSVIYVPSLPETSVWVLDAVNGDLLFTIGGLGFMNEECELDVGMMDSVFAITNFAPLDCNDNGIPDDREYPGCVGIVLGDMNCDAFVNGRDIQLFVDYLVIDPYTCQADINQDGVVDIYDVPLFVGALLSP